MKVFASTLASLCLCISGMIAWPAIADDQIYKTTDAAGNPVFTDSAPENASAVDVPETQTYPAQDIGTSNPTSNAKPGAVKQIQYTDMQIVSPEPNSSVRSNAGSVTIVFNLTPELQSGNQLELVMDGKVVSQLTSVTPVNLGNVDRGTHQLLLRVTDANGAVLQEGPVSVFTLHRHSILLPKSKNATN